VVARLSRGGLLLLRAVAHEAVSNFLLDARDGELREARLIGDELGLEGALAVDAFRIYLLVAQEPMFSVVVESLVLIRIQKRPVRLQEGDLVQVLLLLQVVPASMRTV